MKTQENNWLAGRATLFNGEIMIASFHAEIFREMHGEVCKDRRGNNLEIPENYEEAYLNAKLASAAPDLLYALKLAIAPMEGMDTNVFAPEACHWLTLARAAIQKAEGVK